MNFIHWLLWSILSVNAVHGPSPIVRIDQGVLSGKLSHDGTFYEYLGIPYGSLNEGTRFKQALPPPSWNGVYKADKLHPGCLQRFLSSVVGTEDCLKINIYVPSQSKAPIPVMLFTHGGAFEMGDGGKVLQSPEFLVRHGVILVTYNYRLGPLGFLCLGIKEAPGNAGLKDQLAALRWVKKNIASFGGDPDNITIFGESAGAACVSYMVASNLTNGLFKRAIVQSGSSISNWALNRHPIRTARHLAKSLGSKNISSHPLELYTFLSEVPIEELVRLRTTPLRTYYFNSHLIDTPCLEKKIDGVEPFLSDLPYNTLNAGLNKDITLMYGSNDKEGLLFLNEDAIEELQKRVNDGLYIIASDLQYLSKMRTKLISEKVKSFYFGQKSIVSSSAAVMKLMTEYNFEIPMLLETDLLIDRSNLTVFNYCFKYSGKRNLVKTVTGYDVAGAAHGDDLFYLFDTALWPFTIDEDDQRIIDWMTKMWTNFAKFGDPTPETAKDLPLKWTPSTMDQKRFLYIDKQLSMGPIPNEKSYEFWKNIYDKYRKLTVK